MFSDLNPSFCLTTYYLHSLISLEVRARTSSGENVGPLHGVESGSLTDVLGTV